MFKDHFKTTQKIIRGLLPPPHFLTMPSHSINISDHSVKVMKIVQNNQMELTEFGDESIPDDVIKSGNIIDREKLIEVLRKVKEKYGINFARVSLPEEKAYVFKIRIPNANNDKEIRNNIEFQLEDNVPLSVNEALFDYSIVPGSLKKNQMEVMVFVLPQKVVASFISILKNADIVPISFEIEAESIARAIIKKGDLSTYMIVDYGRTRTGFSVVSSGVVSYTSTAEIGGEYITNAVKEIGLKSLEEVEKIKNESGLIKNPDYPNLSVSLTKIVSVLMDEINKRYIFWHTHKDSEGKVGEKITKIFLVGGNSNLFGLEDYLSSGLKVSVERANVWTNVLFDDDFIPPINFKDSLGHASSVGLAIRKFP